MKRLDLAIQLVASLGTLAGMWIGSTTLPGASCYLVATLAWMAISWRNNLHGIWPLNAGSLVISCINIGRALA